MSVACKPVRPEAARTMTIRIHICGSTSNTRSTLPERCFQKPVLRECHKNRGDLQKLLGNERSRASPGGAKRRHCFAQQARATAKGVLRFDSPKKETARQIGACRAA